MGQFWTFARDLRRLTADALSTALLGRYNVAKPIALCEEL
jgi:hypothetical protein